MKQKILTMDVTKVGEGHLETMMSINGSPIDISHAIVEVILKLNDCVNQSGMFKVNNGFWVMLQDYINEELTERAKKMKTILALLGLFFLMLIICTGMALAIIIWEDRRKK